MSWTGKPAKNSWASYLESQKSIWATNPQVDYSEVTDAQAAKFVDATTVQTPSQSFDSSVSRVLDVGETEEE